MRLFLTVVSCALLPSAAMAGPLTYTAALERAGANAPSIGARVATTSAARSARIAADRLPDPTLDLGLQDFPVSGPNAGRFTRDDFTTQTIGLSQKFTNPAKRHAMAARANADIGIAEAGELVETRSVRLETALAWIDLYYGERRLAQLASLDHGLNDLQKTASGRLASGTARPSQLLEPEQLRAKVADRRAEMVAGIAQARARLARFTGEARPETEGSPPDMEIDRDRLMAGIDSLPNLRAFDAATSAADADVDVARADKRPDWTLNASYGHRNPDFGDMVSVGVSIDLPIFPGRRQNPKIAARASEAQSARLAREAAKREMVAALEADLADHDMHHERLRNARETLLPLATRRANLDRDSYAAGKVDLGTALMATLEAAEAEVETLNREAEVARDAVRINITYGEERP